MNKETEIQTLERRIKFLEDNAFSDRARIGELENKLKCLSEEYHEFIAYNSGARD